MFRLGYIFNLCLTWAVFTSSYKFPSDIERCTFSDSECLSKVVTGILQLHYKGHRGLNILQFDPLHVDGLVLERVPESPVNVEFRFKDVDLIGTSGGTVLNFTGFKKEASDLVFEIQQQYPKFLMTGQYSVDGCVFNHPITGQGNGSITFDDFKVTTKANCTTRKRFGRTYLNIDDIEIDLQPRKVTFALENLFNGDKALSDEMNQLLNDKWDVVFSELKSVFERAFAQIAKNIFNGTFSTIPYADLFLKSE